MSEFPQDVTPSRSSRQVRASCLRSERRRSGRQRRHAREPSYGLGDAGCWPGLTQPSPRVIRPAAWFRWRFVPNKSGRHIGAGMGGGTLRRCLRRPRRDARGALRAAAWEPVRDPKRIFWSL